MVLRYLCIIQWTGTLFSNCLGSKHNDHAQDVYGGGYGDLLVLVYIVLAISSHGNYVNHGFADLTQKNLPVWQNNDCTV